MSSTSSITLIPSGGREVVDTTRASEIVSEWKNQLEANPGLSVEKMVLTNKSYTADASRVIQEFVLENGLVGSMKVADLSDIIASRMEDEGLEVLKVICDAFENAELVEVDLSDNAMGSKGITACTSVLSGQATSLERLSLCNNGLSGTSMQEVADVLCNDIEGKESTIASRLTKIHFYNNMSGDEGCTAFSRILSYCSSKLTDVRFSGTRAGRQGSLRVARAMDSIGSSVENVTRWDLADNTFGDDGGAVLANSLKRCPKLKDLNLRDCSLGDEGIIFVCQALIEANCPLEVLDLSGNEITPTGAKAVAGLLREVSDTLLNLFIEENELTSKGVAIIAKVLPKCSSLREIKLGMNECGNIGADALSKIASELKSLEKIELDNNMFSGEMLKNLEDTYGDLLVEMEDNDDEEDPDEDLTDDEENEDDVDALADSLQKATI